ncbi:Sec-independent protein translocase subunit TatA/TatB [Daejeonella lutea]|uniref:Sec-independent protein translocase protein TatA n=1 Tax=Daejeonella lutea TaxID=572036 RepID=A0A1T5B5N3_9SPHI|nr:twin-arginine translocase TatA/TatE family subunit [Daejeonella lutea]SKB42552.1 sec-independent protein translocase protein TatA [Daejeonella lutea]
MGLGAPELIMIGVVVLLLFGGKKLPELMRGLGKGINEFKNAKDGTIEETAKPAPVSEPAGNNS